MDSTKNVSLKGNKNKNEGKKQELSEAEDLPLRHSSESSKEEEENGKKTKEEKDEIKETTLSANEISPNTFLKQVNAPAASSLPFYDLSTPIDNIFAVDGVLKELINEKQNRKQEFDISSNGNRANNEKRHAQVPTGYRKQTKML